MLVHVTQEDIDNGKRTDCKCCPIALAIGRIFPDSVIHVIRDIHVFSKTGIDSKIYKHTDASRAFVTRFDARDPVEPFEFELSC